MISRPPQTRPSSAFMASSASRSSTNSMKPKPRGRLPARSRHRVGSHAEVRAGSPAGPRERARAASQLLPLEACAQHALVVLLMILHKCFLEGQAAVFLFSRGTRPSTKPCARACQRTQGASRTPAARALRPGRAAGLRRLDSLGMALSQHVRGSCAEAWRALQGLSAALPAQLGHGLGRCLDRLPSSALGPWAWGTLA